MLGQESALMQNLVLLAPAFNMMGKHAQGIPAPRRDEWQHTGWMPWADDPSHKNFPLSWKLVEESQTLWDQRFQALRRVPTTILHGLQDDVIFPKGSWGFTNDLLTQDPHYPIELLLKTEDHRFSGPANLETF